MPSKWEANDCSFCRRDPHGFINYCTDCYTKRRIEGRNRVSRNCAKCSKVCYPMVRELPDFESRGELCPTCYAEGRKNQTPRTMAANRNEELLEQSRKISVGIPVTEDPRSEHKRKNIGRDLTSEEIVFARMRAGRLLPKEGEQASAARKRGCHVYDGVPDSAYVVSVRDYYPKKWAWNILWSNGTRDGVRENGPNEEPLTRWGLLREEIPLDPPGWVWWPRHKMCECGVANHEYSDDCIVCEASLKHLPPLLGDSRVVNRDQRPDRWALLSEAE